MGKKEKNYQGAKVPNTGTLTNRYSIEAWEGQTPTRTLILGQKKLRKRGNTRKKKKVSGKKKRAQGQGCRRM